jgi:serpin B
VPSLRELSANRRQIKLDQLAYRLLGWWLRGNCMKLALRVTAALIGLGLSTGCGGAGSKPDAVESSSASVTEVQSDAARFTPDPSEATRAGTSEQEFGVDFLLVEPADSNLVFSPHSLSTALAMLTDAAAGDTLTQIADTFHFGTIDETFQRSEDALALGLSARNRDAIVNTDQRVDAQILNQSNDIWIRKGQPPVASYLDTLAQYYGAGVHQADFLDDAEGVRAAIDQKVSDDTQGLIPELIPPHELTPDTLAVLTNALYFKAPWADPFDAPAPGSFNELDGSVATVDMMGGIGTWEYYAGNGFVSVAVPYYGAELELLLLVPDLGTYDTFRSSLTSSLLDQVVAQRSATSVVVTLPKFSVTSAVSAKQVLQELGMPVPFESGVAEFPKLGGQAPYISAVLHQATIAVDEKGTEASAATAVILTDQSIAVPSTPLVVTVDRPFVFALRDNPTGALLFLGQVVAP